MYFDRKRRAWMPGIKRGTLMLVLFFAIAAVAAITQIDLTTQVKGILAAANGGTGIAYFTASGPTAARTYAFPDASTTVLTTNAAVTVPQGGTGVAALTAHYGVLGNGTSAVTLVAPGTSGTCWISNGASADPSWQSCPGGLSFADAEVPTGTIDGSNAAFTLAHTPNPAASLNCNKNGQIMYAGGADFTLATATITYTTGAKPKTGDVHSCSYRY
jgi:hypothetical protein